MTLPPVKASHDTALVNQNIPASVKDYVITQINAATASGQFRIHVIIPTGMTSWGLPLMWWLKYSNYISVYKDLGDTTGLLTIQW